MFQIDKEVKKHFHEQNNKTMKKYSDLRKKLSELEDKLEGLARL